MSLATTEARATGLPASSITTPLIVPVEPALASATQNVTTRAIIIERFIDFHLLRQDLFACDHVVGLWRCDVSEYVDFISVSVTRQLTVVLYRQRCTVMVVIHIG